MRMKIVTHVDDTVWGRSTGVKKELIDYVSPSDLDEHVWPSINDKASKDTVKDVKSDLKDLEKDFNITKKDGIEWLEHLDKTIQGPRKDGKGGLLKDVKDLASTYETAQKNLDDERTAIRRELKKACDGIGHTEHRLRQVIEDGGWRDEFGRQIATIINSLELQVKRAHDDLDKDIQAIQQEVADTRSLEKSIQDKLSLHEEVVRNILRDKGDEISLEFQRIQQVCAEAVSASDIAKVAQQQSELTKSSCDQAVSKALAAAQDAIGAKQEIDSAQKGALDNLATREGETIVKIAEKQQEAFNVCNAETQKALDAADKLTKLKTSFSTEIAEAEKLKVELHRLRSGLGWWSRFKWCFGASIKAAE